MVVTKIPRFTFEKFPGTPSPALHSMKSVGEAMSIGRNFAEALQKGLRSMETGLSGGLRSEVSKPPGDGGGAMRIGRRFVGAGAGTAADGGAGAAGRALSHVDDMHEAYCKFDPWFCARTGKTIVDAEARDRFGPDGLPPTRPAPLRRIKALGFSDVRLARR